MNWTRGTGGGGAIDLVIHLEGGDFKTALDWLVRHFGGADPSTISGDPQRAPPTSTLALPRRDPGRLSQVTRYLIHERCLAASSIEPLVSAGRIYADQRGNAIFLLLGKEEKPVGAEIRGTTAKSWKGMAPGSRKDAGYFSAGSAGANTIVLCESAIDALNCAIFHPGTWCISTAGARPKPRWRPALLEGTRDVRCGFDADETGDATASRMTASHPRVTRLRPPLKDWNDALRARRDAPAY